MKSFKQYLNEAKIDRESSHSTEIRFDALGSGFHCDIDPFCSDYWDDFAKIHTFSIGVFSSGSVEYSRKATENEIEQHQKVLNKEIDPKKGPYWLITQEMKKVMNTEILKAVNEFDKKIEAILKKHGFEKRSK